MFLSAWSVRCGVALLATLALVQWHGACAEGPVTLRMEMYGPAGVPVLTLHTRLNEERDRYSVGVDYATSGMAKLFVDLKTRAEVQGRLTPSTTTPTSYRSESRRNGVERRSRVDYKPDGSVDAGSTPPLPQPITTGAMRGTVDNLSAYLQLERQLVRTGRCAMSVAVFDGRHRYDLQFTDAGKQMLSPTGGQNFNGETIACRMRRIDRGIPGDEQNEGATAGTIWYARLIPGDFMIPVRMQMDTQLGSVDGLLAELHGPGVNLTLMR